MNQHKPIYLDYAATTPIDEEVLEVMNEVYRETVGNPSSIHYEGRKARDILERARRRIAQMLGVAAGELYFTSSATEANNWILYAAVRDLGVRHLITSPLEHPSIVQTVRFLQQQYSDLNVHWLVFDDWGAPRLDTLEEILSTVKDQTVLVSLMHANNELGTLTDIAAVGALCKDYGAYFHSDTVQTLGYYPFEAPQYGVDFFVGSAHKFYGPKGIGIAYIRKGIAVRPLLHGGGQERSMRSGTEHIPAIAAMAKALDIAPAHRPEKRRHMEQLWQYLQRRVDEAMPFARCLHEDLQRCHYKIFALALPDEPEFELAVLRLDVEGVCVSGGSACSSGAEQQTHVSKHFFQPKGKRPLRLSLSHRTTREEIDVAIETMQRVFAHIG